MYKCVLILFIMMLLSSVLYGADGLLLEVELQDEQGTRHHYRQWIDPAKTAVVVVDMWDNHWCKGFLKRVPELFTPLNVSLEVARKLGMQIVYAPAECRVTAPTSPWAPTSYRRDWATIPRASAANVRRFSAAEAMPGYRDGFCQCPRATPGWPCELGPGPSNQAQAINQRMKSGDLITDSGDELYSLARHRGITTLLYTGVASNWCVWNRPFGMMAMYQNGLDTYLVRDLAQSFTGDGMNPEGDGAHGVRDEDFTPAIGDRIVVDHFERNGVGTIARAQLVQPLIPEPPPPVNIALKRKATCSSAYFNANGGYAQGADHAVDGEQTGDRLMCSNTGDQAPWWEVDLGEATLIERLCVWGHHGLSSRLLGAKAQVLDDQRREVWSTDLRDMHRQDLIPGKPVSGRFVRISKKGEYLDFNEVEVFPRSR